MKVIYCYAELDVYPCQTKSTATQGTNDSNPTVMQDRKLSSWRFTSQLNEKSASDQHQVALPAGVLEHGAHRYLLIGVGIGDDYLHYV